ncbi:MAG: hypothetical protein CL910_12515 [Deltaproteobacteria bacterium]|jgi:DUF4097 and DUF4098 domain-containing protein YvlB|nr:hypothetical protein [Deltaproteobacteria bacterium]
MDDRNEVETMTQRHTQLGRIRAAMLCAAGAAMLMTAAAEAEDLERTIDVEPGGKLRIDLPGGHIEVDTHDDATVELDGYASGRFRFEVREDKDEVVVRGRHEGFLPFFVGRVEVHARVPEIFSLDLVTRGGRIDVQDLRGDVEAHTSGGSIEIQEVEGEVEVSTSGGRIQAKEIQGSLDAETSGGSIHVSEVSGDANLRTSGGGIRVREAAGEVRARTSGGPIEVRFVDTPRGDLRTSGGSIDVEVEEDAGFDLHAETSGGRIELDEDLAFSGEVDRSEARGKIAGGGPHLELRTSGGSVRIRPR